MDCTQRSMDLKMKPPDKDSKWWLGGPSLCTAATVYLDHIIKPEYGVVECGCGRSTIWLAWKCDAVFSIEHNEEWANAVRAVLSRMGVCNTLVSVVDHEDILADAIDYMTPDGGADIIIVDCIDGQRVACIQRAVKNVRSGGFVVVDDTHRPWLKGAANAAMPGWDKVIISGNKYHDRTDDYRWTETTFYQKPQ